MHQVARAYRQPGALVENQAAVNCQHHPGSRLGMLYTAIRPTDHAWTGTPMEREKEDNQL